MSIHDPARIDLVKSENLASDADKAVGECVRSIRDIRRELVSNTVEVTLPNATAVTVKTKLGRKWTSYSLSAVSGAVAAGYINELTPDDRTTDIKLQATGFGATVTVRLTVQ
jgi:hypothetical protein